MQRNAETDPEWKCMYTFYGFSYFFRRQTLRRGQGNGVKERQIHNQQQPQSPKWQNTLLGQHLCWLWQYKICHLSAYLASASLNIPLLSTKSPWRQFTRASFHELLLFIKFSSNVEFSHHFCHTGFAVALLCSTASAEKTLWNLIWSTRMCRSHNSVLSGCLSEGVKS